MQNSPQFLLALAVLSAVALFAAIVMFVAWQKERRRSQARIEQLLADHEKRVVDARRESVDKSRSSLKGRIAEQMAPLLPGFQYPPADARFLGDPIDYVVFNGYTELRDNGDDGAAMEIVLLEVKQGASALTSFQRAIARSVEEGRFRFEVLRISENGSAATEAWQPRRPRGVKG